MAPYNTLNPPGSTDPRDLRDNAQNLDQAVNGITNKTWTDRLGRIRKSWSGMEYDFNNQIADQETRFRTFIENAGYDVIGDYG